MPQAAVITQTNAFRAALLRTEAAQMRGMVRQWATVERALQDGIAETLHQIDLLRLEGQILGRYPDPYLQLDRYRTLLAQTRRELARYADFAEAEIQQGIAANARAGVSQSTEQIEIMADGDPTVLGNFNRMSAPAIENMVALLQDDAPVDRLLREAFPEAAVRMTDALVTGTALGWNPRKTAAAMIDGLQSGALQRALVIARSEQLRSLRTASLTNLRQSNITTGYYRIAAKGPRTCLACLLADGTFYELESEFDAHPQCVIEGTIVSAPTIQGTAKRFYDGPVVDIVTVGGNHLTVTPNHPILTDHGWVAARLLKVGDNVIGSRNGERPTLLVDPNQQHGPARIEDIVAAFGEFSQVPAVSVPVSPVDFHGDGMGSDVCIIGANGLLESAFDLAFLQPASQHAFIVGNSDLGLFPAVGSPAQSFKSAFSSPGGLLRYADAAQVFLLGSSRREQLVSFGLATDDNAGINQATADSAAGNAVLGSNGVFGFTREIVGDYLRNGKSGGVLVALDPAFTHVAIESGVSDTVTLANDPNIDTAEIVIDRIVDCSSRQFSGHVYNLQTVTGWYVANGIITHNCRCVLIPAIKGREPPAFTHGRAWLEAQPASVQRQIMGTGAYNAWQDGAVTLDDLVTRHDHPVWGGSLGTRALRDVLGAETARRYSESATYTQFE